jgi:hypothetical protein
MLDSWDRCWPEEWAYMQGVFSIEKVRYIKKENALLSNKQSGWCEGPGDFVDMCGSGCMVRQA